MSRIVRAVALVLCVVCGSVFSQNLNSGAGFYTARGISGSGNGINSHRLDVPQHNQALVIPSISANVEARQEVLYSTSGDFATGLMISVVSALIGLAVYFLLFE